MKLPRQQVLSDFFLKKPKSGEDITPITKQKLLNIVKIAEAKSQPSDNIVQLNDQIQIESLPSPNYVQIGDEDKNILPDCWKPSQFQDFQKKYNMMVYQFEIANWVVIIAYN